MDGIIFDIDGTLWDSTQQVAVAWNEALRENSDIKMVLTSEILKKEFGKPLEEIIEDLFPEEGQDVRDAIAGHLYSYENDLVRKAPCHLYEGMQETVRELSKSYRLFIVSNCQAGYPEAFLENTGLADCIEAHLCPGETGLLKADNIRKIVEDYHLEDPVYVGDTAGDAMACKEAGVPMIYAAYGFGEVKDADAEIQNFFELPAVIKEMEKDRK